MATTSLKSWISEFSRRNVIRVAAAYIVGAWFVLQVFDLAADNLNAPPWVMPSLFVMLCIGFVVSLILSWIFEITADGIKKEKDLHRKDSLTKFSAKRLDIVTILLLISTITIIMWTGDFSPYSSPLSSDAESVQEPHQSNPQQQDNNQSQTGSQRDSIAVLPFSNMANLPENEPFTAGIHDDLLTQLSKINGLKVISRTSVMRYRDTVMSIQDIAKELEVATILEGSVQRAGNQVRINVQLIDAQKEGHVWAEVYDRELSASKLFEIQSDITTQIAKAMERQLSESYSAQTQNPPTQSLEAYNLVNSGKQLLRSRIPENIVEAEGLFKQAIEIDQNYSEAYASLADNIVLLYYYTGLPFTEMQSRAGPLLEKAIKLNPESAGAHSSMGSFQRFTGNLAAAEASFKTALQLNPNHVSSYERYASLLRRLGRNTESLDLIERAVGLDPMSEFLQEKHGKSLAALGDHEAALEKFKRAVQLNPESASAIASSARIYRTLGNLNWAAQWQERAVRLNPISPPSIDQLGRAYLDLGLIEQAKQLISNADQKLAKSDGLAVLQARIFLYEHESKRGLKHALSMAKKFAGNEVVEANVPVFQFLNADYSATLDSRLSNYDHESIEQIKFTNSDVYQAPELVFSLLKLNNETAAKQLIRDAKLLLLKMHPGDRGFTHARLLAASGDPVTAAEAFAAAVDSGVRKDWWRTTQFEYMQETTEQPTFQKAWKVLNADISAQREEFLTTISD